MPKAMPRREVAKPGESRTMIGVLPIVSATARTSAMVSSAVRSPRTISISFITCGGLKKCTPQNRR